MCLLNDDEEHPMPLALIPVIKRYAASFESLFEEVDGYVAKADTAAIASFLHRVKGTSAMLGMSGVSAFAASCEHASQSEEKFNLDGLKAAMREARSRWDSEATEDGASAPSSD